MPDWQRDGIELYLGDALEILPELDVRPNITLADPPWNIGKDFGEGVNDAMSEPEYERWLFALSQCVFKAAPPDACCYWFCPSFQLLGAALHLPAILRATGWTVREKELLVWYRPNGVGPRKRARGQVWARMAEFIVYAVKGKGLLPKPSELPKAERQPWYHNVLTICTPQTNHAGGRCHVCQKPTRLYSYLIRAHQGVNLVLDPTMGSGSSIMVAARLGIPAIGIELVPETFDLAVRRIEQALDGGPSNMNEAKTTRSLFAEEIP